MTKPLSEQTPFEIDTRLAELEPKYWSMLESRRRALDILSDGEAKQTFSRESGWSSKQVWPDPRRSRRMGRDLVRVVPEMDALFAKISPRREEYDRRRWSRFFLVTNGNGHVHSSMRCSTCFPTTQYGWLPNLSGKTEDEAVEEWGERMCTVCFPSAPTNPNYNRPAKVDREAREKKAAEKAERAAKKAAKGITNPDGTPIKLKSGRFGERIKSHRAAQIALTNALVDILEYSKPDPDSNLDYAATKVQEAAENTVTLLRALAHKEGRSTEEIRAEAAKKAKAKYKKQLREQIREAGRWAGQIQGYDVAAHRAKLTARLEAVS